MATEQGGPASAGPAAEATSQPQKQDAAAVPKAAGKQAAAAQPEAAGGEKKLSNAELKKKAKEEKAARRAREKAAQAPANPASASASNDGKGGKAKLKQDASHGGQQHARPPLRPVGPTTSVIKDNKPKIPECFTHLSVARRIDMTEADKDVHPAVLTLGQHMSTFAISDSITRLEATLLAFKQVRLSPITALDIMKCLLTFLTRSLIHTQHLTAPASQDTSHPTF